jgi:hypothetical protein
MLPSPEEFNNRSDLPELNAYQASKLGLEIGALEHGVSIDKELTRRMEALGGRVVSKPEDQPLARMLRTIKNIGKFVTRPFR